MSTKSTPTDDSTPKNSDSGSTGQSDLFGKSIPQFLVGGVVVTLLGFFANHWVDDIWKRLDTLETQNRNFIGDFKTHRELERSAHENLSVAIAALESKQSEENKKIIDILLQQAKERDKVSQSNGVLQLKKLRQAEMYALTELKISAHDEKTLTEATDSSTLSIGSIGLWPFGASDSAYRIEASDISAASRHRASGVGCLTKAIDPLTLSAAPSWCRASGAGYLTVAIDPLAPSAKQMAGNGLWHPFSATPPMISIEPDFYFSGFPQPENLNSQISNFSLFLRNTTDYQARFSPNIPLNSLRIPSPGRPVLLPPGPR